MPPEQSDSPVFESQQGRGGTTELFSTCYPGRKAQNHPRSVPTAETYAPSQNLITLHNTVCIVLRILPTALLLTGPFPEGKFQELKSYNTHIPECFLNFVTGSASAMILTFTSQ